MGLIETSSREWIKTAPLRNLSKFPGRVIYSQTPENLHPFHHFSPFVPILFPLRNAPVVKHSFHNSTEFFENKTIRTFLLLDRRESNKICLYFRKRYKREKKEKRKKESNNFYNNFPFLLPSFPIHTFLSSSNYEISFETD